MKRFWQDYFGNGQLHIVNADTGELIGRKDAYLPMNMYLDQRAPPRSSRTGRRWRNRGASATGNSARKWSATRAAMT